MRFWAALVVFTTLAFVLQATHGIYGHDSLFALTALVPILFVAAFLHRKPALNIDRPRRRDSLLAILVAAESLSLAARPSLIYATKHSTSLAILNALLWVAALLLILNAVGLIWLDTMAYLCAVPAVLFLITARVLVVFASPNPHIDVFTIDLAAVDYLSRGINPYSQVYADIYNGQFTYVPRLSYPPGFLALVYPATKYLGDPRWASVACDLATGFGVFAVGRKSGASPRTAALLAMSWLAFPTSLFVIEQAWADALSLPFLVWGTVALGSRRNMLAGVLFGMAIMVKQYSVAAPFFAAIALWRLSVRAPDPLIFHANPSNQWAEEPQPPPKLAPKVVTLLRDRADLRMLAATAAVCVLFLAPFLIWDAPAWFESNVHNFMVFAPRKDALTWFAYAVRTDREAMGSFLALAALIVALAGGVIIVTRKSAAADDLPARVAGATSFFLLLGFLFAKQAFCNYYYFIAGLVLAAVAAMAQTGRDADADS